MLTGKQPAVRTSRFALLCIDTQSKAIRRYWRNPLSGRAWMTHESELLCVNENTLKELDHFRMFPEDFDLAPTEAA